VVVGDEGTGSRSVCKTINFEAKAEPIEQTPNPLKKPSNLTVSVNNTSHGSLKSPSPIARDGSPRDISSVMTTKRASPQKDEGARASLYSYESPKSRETPKSASGSIRGLDVATDKLNIGTLNPNPDEVRGFDINREVLSMITLPQIDPSESIKNRISYVEDVVTVQAKINAIHAELFNDLDGDLAKVQAYFPPVLDQIHQRHVEDIAAVRSEYEHKFELQAAENLRMQQHIVALKAENEMFKRRFVSTCICLYARMSVCTGRLLHAVYV
jgi:hypothetical protein